MDKIPLPNKFELNEVDANRATLTIEPLFAGYGITIGNALRRVLLSSIPGAAFEKPRYMAGKSFAGNR